MASKGKKLTSNQRKILEASGKVRDISEYLYIGIRHIDPEGYRAPSKNCDVLQVMEFRNRYSGEIVTVEI